MVNLLDDPASGLGARYQFLVLQRGRAQTPGWMLRHPQPHHGARQSDGHDGERQDSYPGTTPRWPRRAGRRLRRAAGRSRSWRGGRWPAAVEPGLALLSGVSAALSGVSAALSGLIGTVALNGTLRLYAMWRTKLMISFSIGLWLNSMLGLKTRIGLNGNVFPLSVDVISGLTRRIAGRPSTGGALCLVSSDFLVLFGPFGTLGPDGSLYALPDFLRQHGRRRC
jgi:hypothetical protein